MKHPIFPTGPAQFLVAEPGAPVIQKPSLADFLIDDIDDGHRLLLPFLTTKDRLMLSECCSDLLPYRFNLSRVKIVCPDDLVQRKKEALWRAVERDPRIRKTEWRSYWTKISKWFDQDIVPPSGKVNALAQLLQDQETTGTGGLHVLSVGHRRFMGVLDIAPSGCSRSLKFLQLRRLRLDAQDVMHLRQALVDGWLKNLTGLDFSHNFLCTISPSGVSEVMGALEHGACPLLQHLILTDICFWHPDPLGPTIAQALASGSLAHLESLNLTHTMISGPGSTAAIATALEQAVCPQLQKLTARDCHLEGADCQALGRVIEAGRCAQLEHLDLSSNHLMDPGVTTLGRGLLGSRNDSHRLKTLDLADVSMGPEGARAPGSAFASGKMSCLQIVDIRYNPMVGDEAMKEVMIGLKECHQLLGMVVSGTYMGRMTGGALVEALEERAWPDLKVLDLGGNFELFEDKEVSIGLVELIEEGQLQNLDGLTIRGSGMKREEVVRILRAVKRGECPKLTTLQVDKNVTNKWVLKLKARGVELRRG